jgi:hypothetical protein
MRSLQEKHQTETEFRDGNIFRPKIIKLGRNLRRNYGTNILLNISLLFWDGIAILSQNWDGIFISVPNYKKFVILRHYLATLSLEQLQIALLQQLLRRLDIRVAGFIVIFFFKYSSH